MYTIISIIIGFIYAEFFGYWLHVLLHSNKITYLSRSHMLHHLEAYGPKVPQRSKDYIIPPHDVRFKLFGYGLEWIGPIVLSIVINFIIAWFLSISLYYMTIVTFSALIWGYTLFGYMHSAMHLANFWMLKNRLFKSWFTHIRKLHDIHHIDLDDLGRMRTNYGICFFFFDKLFGTYVSEFRDFNEKGNESAKERYSYIYN